MRATSGTRIGQSGIALLLVLTSLLVQGNVRADTPLTAHQQDVANRITIGLLQRGKNLVDVLDYIVDFEDCGKGNQLSCDAVGTAGARVGIRSDHTYEDIASVEGLGGFWFVYEGFGKTTGRITVGAPPTGRGGNNGDFAGTAKFSPKGSADFSFYRDGDGNYDFQYTNDQGDAGTGYLVWQPSGCTLLGFFFSQTFKDQNGNYNSAIIVFRRC